MTLLNSIPDTIENEPQLNEVLTRPSPELVEMMRGLDGNLLILGAGGKMGPTLALRAQRAIEAAQSQASIVAASRFSDPASREMLQAAGIRTECVDLLDRDSMARLPDAQNIIYLVGCKFGTSSNPAQTWAINTLVPGHAIERYPDARVVALSTGNVYPLMPVSGKGAAESQPIGPIGEYANAAVARERMFEYWSRQTGAAITQIRLNYATDIRYGVLTDIAIQVAADQPIDVTQGYLNCIWQGDANDAILRSLALAESPPRIMNLTGPEQVSVRSAAETFGRLLNRPVRITGSEAPNALLSDAAQYCRVLGPPLVSIDTIIRWTAHWIQMNGRLLNKPTHFEVRDGAF
ncbi:NAD-dependent epimerase/dehydratase family protein [Blastopirellula sp. J2-11]|uniref:NAD-dependent epimerase/dehydratase family protein n=1 Tax=Blastopirellula sp. J2-11 TaxID=2943192 RepID=UPI0021C69ABC|nr:NAD-dependent epimerase/dehydratase family protein [Blastopirellula sp. J2-11]UUO04382.1 NAD-dependent epimerase/dehydratase family protein [Blastopirellula sp. J2-11]